MARNRKRAKERRARRPQPVTGRPRDLVNGPPSPLEHAAPDAELAEQAEMGLGATQPNIEEWGGGESEVELAAEEAEPFEAVAEPLGQADEEPLEEEAGPFEDEAEPTGAGGDGGGTGFGGGLVAAGGGAAALPEPHVRPRNRLTTFVLGSWAELQRVQWPDRRQVMQATGVVIGFVIVAGIWLGVADWAAQRVVNFILNGHF